MSQKVEKIVSDLLGEGKVPWAAGIFPSSVGVKWYYAIAEDIMEPHFQVEVYPYSVKELLFAARATSVTDLYPWFDDAEDQEEMERREMLTRLMCIMNTPERVREFERALGSGEDTLIYSEGDVIADCISLDRKNAIQKAKLALT